MERTPSFSGIDTISPADKSVSSIDLRLATIFAEAEQNPNIEVLHQEGVHAPHKYLKGRTGYSEDISTDDSNVLVRLKKYDLADNVDSESSVLVGDIVIRDTATPHIDTFRLRHNNQTGEYELFRLMPHNHTSRVVRLAGFLTRGPNERHASLHDIVIVNKYLRHFEPEVASL